MSNERKTQMEDEEQINSRQIDSLDIAILAARDTGRAIFYGMGAYFLARLIVPAVGGDADSLNPSVFVYVAGGAYLLKFLFSHAIISIAYRMVRKREAELEAHFDGIAARLKNDKEKILKSGLDDDIVKVFVKCFDNGLIVNESLRNSEEMRHLVWNGMVARKRAEKQEKKAAFLGKIKSLFAKAKGN